MFKPFHKIAFAVLIAVSSTNVFAQDTKTDREAAVERYFQAVSFDSMIGEMSEEMAKQLPADQRADFLKFMTTEVRFDEIKISAKASLAKHLTTEELNAFAAFMESPVGKSAMSKMKYYMADVMPVIQAEVARALEARKSSPAKG